MRWLWLTAFFTAFFWLHIIPIYTRSVGSWLWFILPAVIAAGMGLRKAAVHEFDPRWLFLLLAAGFAYYVLPFPYSLPVLLISLSILLLSTARLSASIAWVGLPVGFVGTVLAFQTAGYSLLYVLSSRVHEVPALSPLIYGIARIFHSGVALSEHNVIINYVYDVFEFPTRLEALGLMPAGLFAIAGVVALAALRRPVKIVLGFLALVAGYSVLRYVLMIFLTVRLKTASIFWLQVPLAVSYVPLVIVLMAIPWWGRRSESRRFGAPWPATRRLIPALALIAAGVACIIGNFAYHDAGVPKQGRLLIDELHSDWEWTTEEYDTEWYGRRSGYNYYSLAEYLKKHFHVEVTSEPLLGDLLSRFDIMMLKTPTSPLSAEEIDALVEFVRDGGGLWILGDHTNVFGTSTYINQLIRHFGLRLRYDSTYDLRTMKLSVFERPVIFPHPVVAFMPPYLFATSCSMEAPFFSENMIIGYGMKAMELDYAETSFFPEKESRNYSFGVFLQQGGIKFGKGRVALFTDSTCFSNFFMFIPGKPELALGTVEWLNRANKYHYIDRILLIAGIILLAAAVHVVGKWRYEQVAVLGLVAGIFGFAVAVPLYEGHVERSYPLPRPHTDFMNVAFDAEHSGFTLPILGLTRFPESSLHTFFVWTQRIGLFPSYVPTLEEAVSSGDLVVIAKQAKALEEAEADALLEYVEKGGRLLVLIDAEQPGQGTSQLLDMFGMSLESRYQAPEHAEGGVPQAPPGAAWEEAPWQEEEAGEEEGPSEGEEPGEGEVTDEESEDRIDILTLQGEPITPASRPGGLAGGEPLLLLSDGRVVLAEARIGEGRVFVFSDFYLFTVDTMGHTGLRPQARQRSIFELEYYMLREILDMPQPPLLWESEDRQSTGDLRPARPS